MTYQEFKAIVSPLAVQLGAEWDVPTWKLYHRAVEKIPIQLFRSAVEQAAETRTKFPSAAQLREAAEITRQSLLKVNTYDGCAECESSIGWRPRADLPRSVERCPCFARHQRKLANLGIGGESLAPLLEAAVGERE